MRGAVLYAPRDAHFEERDVPKIMKPTDAILRMSATCVCGSDLWPYRGINPVAQPTPTGHADVMGTGWFAADAANVKPGKTVAVVGDGAVGLLGILSAKQITKMEIKRVGSQASGKGPAEYLTVRYGLIPCSKRLLRHARLAQVPRSNRAFGQHGTSIPLARPSS